jgi:hypothetical protein
MTFLHRWAATLTAGTVGAVALLAIYLVRCVGS